MILVNEKSGEKYDGKFGLVYYVEDDYRKYELLFIVLHLCMYKQRKGKENSLYVNDT